MTMRGTFRFHSVGQGLFYSGLIQKPESDHFRQFSFVYDCGSSSSQKILRREVDDFMELLPAWESGTEKRLDLLMVSHLHDDHVNGLEYLLRDVEVDTVVMPYMEQRGGLLAWIESSGREEFLRDFYADPPGWFAARGVRRVVLIGAPGNDKYRKFDAYLASLNQRSEGRENIRFYSHDIVSGTFINGTEVLSLSAPTAIWWSTYWIFRFSSLKFAAAEEFGDILQEFLTENGCLIKDIIYSDEMKRDLAGRLKKVMKGGKTINRTSLVTVHEPNTFYKTHFRAWDLPGIDELWYMAKEEDNKFYDLGLFSEIARKTVLTGDIEIENEAEAKELGLSQLEDYKIFQYPHHGAQNALPYEVERKILPKNTVTVFSAGIVNKYGHPDPDVTNRQHCTKLVNERHAFDYTVTVS